MTTEALEITIVRHGRTQWNVAGRLQGRTDIPLNDEGRDDARRVAEAVSLQSWQALFTSPLLRAYDTASILGKKIGLEPEVRDCLIERSYGTLEGKSRAQLRQWRAKKGRRSSKVTGMEADSVLRSRALACFNGLAQGHIEGDRVLVVSHGGFINAFLFCISNGKVGSGITQLANGSITRVSWTKAFGWRVISLNDTAHLDRPHGQTDK